MKRILFTSVFSLIALFIYAQHSAEAVQADQSYPNVSKSQSYYSDVPMAGTMGFYTETQYDEFISVPIPAGTPSVPINNGLPIDFYDGDFGPADVFYAVSSLSELYTIDVTTGIATFHQSLSGTFGFTPTALSYDAASGNMYFVETDISTSVLHIVDLNNGVCSFVGFITNAPALINLAIDNTGNAYGVDIITDALISVNLATANGTIVGPIGFDANFAQGADFDPESGIMYLAAFNNTSFQPELRSVDLNTGNSTFISVLAPDQNLREATAFGIMSDREIPLSDWAIVIAFILIAGFIAVRYYRN